MIRKFRNKGGATAIEYALIASLIALVIITAATHVGQSVVGSFQRAAAGFN